MSRVAIIGVGLVTSGGKTLDETWRYILNGNASWRNLPERFLPHVKSDRAHIASSYAPEHKRLLHMALAASDQALGDIRRRYHGLIDAVCVGSTSASFSEVEQNSLDSKGKEVLPKYLMDGLQEIYNIPWAFQTSQACASSSHAIALGADLIRTGQANLVLAGGADEVTCSVLAAFEAVRLHVKACKPFDKDRNGLTLGEAAAFVLMARPGIENPLCYLDGIGLTCDAYDSVASSPIGVQRVIGDTIKDARVSKVDLVVTHGTGTKANDVLEAEAIQHCMGVLGFDLPFITSYKGALGHPQGASGAVGVALAIKAIQEQTVFPTVGCSVVDPEIPEISAMVPLLPIIHTQLENVLVLSFGSWGTNAGLLLTRKEDDLPCELRNSAERELVLAR